MQNRKENDLFKIALTFMIVLFAFTAQVHAETYKLALSLAITGPTSDAGDPYAKGCRGLFQVCKRHETIRR
jgi:branched-chain amino acid transport system substrate-binding protein